MPHPPLETAPDIERLTSRVAPGDAEAAARARARNDVLVKPVGSLGMLEELVARWCGSSGGPPPAPLRAAILVLAADHGVTARGTSAYPSEVSTQVAEAAARGETAIAVLARGRGDRLLIADIGLAGPPAAGVAPHRVRAGTDDITRGPAMSGGELVRSVATGAMLAEQVLEGCDCLVIGEIGIGNTTAASALLHALTGEAPQRVCGRGAGLDDAGLDRKRAAVQTAVAVNGACGAPALEAMRLVGGLELAGLVGAVLASAAMRRPVVVDGFAATVAALVAVRTCPAACDHLVTAHRSAEPGHDIALAELRLRPLLDMGMRLGEASGGAVALPLIEAAGRLHREMATFDGAQVDRASGDDGSDRERGPIG